MVERVKIRVTCDSFTAEPLLRPASIFRTSAEIMEADLLHAEHEEGGPEDREWEVTRRIKHESNGIEFDVRFGFKFSFFQYAYLLKLQLKTPSVRSN